ncbi:MAG: hypothetical protein ACLTDR_13090 [Adlercreutzia equolifaciens]
MADIHFGTDGWRAIIGEDFTPDNLNRVVAAAARIFKEEAVAAGRDADAPGTLIVGHDCRQDAHAYARAGGPGSRRRGLQRAAHRDYCPTPTLCWSVAHNDDAVGGIMLTSSHNPAEYLGVKLRMADGGASPAEFTDRVEAVLPPEPTDILGPFQTADLMTDYLAALRELVDVEAIRGANLRVVCDPLYGAGRHYLADLLRDMGVEVVRNPQRGRPHLRRAASRAHSAPGSMKASRKWASWATMPCSSTTATPTALPLATRAATT